MRVCVCACVCAAAAAARTDLRSAPRSATRHCLCGARAPLFLHAPDGRAGEGGGGAPAALQHSHAHARTHTHPTAQQLMVLLPDLSPRLLRLKPALLAVLMADTNAIAGKLVRLRTLFPRCNVSRVVQARCVRACRVFGV